MKKRTLLICVLLACAMLLASCQGLKDALRPNPKTADELWERIDEVMQEYDAFAMSLEMDMVMVVEGYAMHSKATGTMIEDTGDDYYYYSETDVTVSCEELDVEETAKSISAFMNGKAFEFRGENGYERKLYSKMTAEEYQAYKASDEQDEEPDFQDCTQESFVKNEDKTWTLTYSGYTKKTINIITDAFSGIADVFGADIVDMQVTFRANEDFRVTDIGIAFEFAEQEDDTAAPCLDIRMKLSALGDEVVRVTDTIDVKKYREVDDLAICKQIDKLIDARLEAEQGEFSYELMHHVGVSGRYETTEESSQVKYEKVNGRLSYEIKTKSQEYTATISYKNGTQTVTVDGESYSEPQSEEQAISLIQSMIDDPSLGYDAESVSNIKNMGGGKWEIEQAVTDSEIYKQIIESMGATYKSTSQTIRFTIANDELIKIHNSILMEGTVSSGGSSYRITYNIQITTEFS